MTGAAATVSRAAFLDVAVPTKLPAWRVFATLLLLLAIFLAILGPLLGKLGLPDPTLLATLAFATSRRHRVAFTRVTDTLIDLTLPEEKVLFDFLQGLLERGAFMNVPPCAALCKEQGAITRPKPGIPLIKVLLGRIELAKLRKGNHAHGQVVAEDLAHAIKQPPTGRLLSLFFLFLFLPAIIGDFAAGTQRSLFELRQGTDDMLGLNESNLTFEQSLNWCFNSVSLPWNSRAGFGRPAELVQSARSCCLSQRASRPVESHPFRFSPLRLWSLHAWGQRHPYVSGHKRPDKRNMAGVGANMRRQRAAHSSRRTD